MSATSSRLRRLAVARRHVDRPGSDARRRLPSNGGSQAMRSRQPFGRADRTPCSHSERRRRAARRLSSSGPARRWRSGRGCASPSGLTQTAARMAQAGRHRRHGPTASGKSAAGAGLGRGLGGTVINADAMQIYAPADPDGAALGRRNGRGRRMGSTACCPLAEALSAGALARARAPARSSAGGGRSDPVRRHRALSAALMQGFSPFPPLPADFRERPAALGRDGRRGASRAAGRSSTRQSRRG